MIYFCNRMIFNEFASKYDYYGKEPYVIMSLTTDNVLPKYLDLGPITKVGADILYGMCESKKVNAGVGVTYVNPKILEETIDSPDFDKILLGAIQNSPDLWMLLMNILINAFDGNTVIIEYNLDWVSQCIVESLIKLIQDLYQYNCMLIGDITDVEFELNRFPKSTFGPFGLDRLDVERNRYIQLYNTGQVKYAIGSDVTITKGL